MWIYIIIAIIVLIVIYALALYNSFVKLNNKVKEAFSTMIFQLLSQNEQRNAYHRHQAELAEPIYLLGRA